MSSIYMTNLITSSYINQTMIPSTISWLQLINYENPYYTSCSMFLTVKELPSTNIKGVIRLS